VILVAGADQDRHELIRQCLDIGHDAVVGEIDGGFDAWRGAARAITMMPLVGPDAIAPTLIDVRQRSEFEAGHVPGAINIELGRVLTTPVPDGPITVMCGHGERAMTGASILTARGHDQVGVLDGGPDTWTAWSGEPLVNGR
jgi:rhodanese-related sulfurtransferase